MRCLRLLSFAVFLCLPFAGPSHAQLTPAAECTVCSGYLICGFRDSVDLPECVNGRPCTREQYLSCVSMLGSDPNGRCDRPGVFPEPADSTRYYRCVPDRSASGWAKLPSRCPPDTGFDPTTLQCLTEEEKALLRSYGDLEVRRGVAGEGFRCDRKGVFADPEDCKRYYLCDSYLEAQEYYCPVGTYFQGTGCSEERTEECLEQLVRRSEAEVGEGEAVYRRLGSEGLLGGVVKRDLGGVGGVRYGVYGVGGGDVGGRVSGIGEVVEGVLRKYSSRDEEGQERLQSAIERETTKALSDVRLLRTKLNVGCEGKGSEGSAMTIIVVTDCSRKSSSGGEDAVGFRSAMGLGGTTTTAAPTEVPAEVPQTTTKLPEPSEEPQTTTKSPQPPEHPIAATQNAMITTKQTVSDSTQQLANELGLNLKPSTEKSVMTTVESMTERTLAAEMDDEFSVNDPDTPDQDTLTENPTTTSPYPPTTPATPPATNATDRTPSTAPPDTASPKDAPTANETATQTKFKCRSVGYFRDPTDCHSFYRCRRVRVREESCRDCVERGWKVVPSHHTCRRGRWFSSFLWKCLRSRPSGC